MARNYDSQCRRMDLHLRAKFPYLNTIIYKMEKSSYKIFIENYKDFNQISDYFHHNTDVEEFSRILLLLLLSFLLIVQT